MSTLYGRTPASTYKELLKINHTGGGLDSTLREVEDGAGVGSPLKLAVNKISLHDLVWPSTGASTGKVLKVGASGAALEWASLTTDDITEGAKKYFTQARARTAISVSGALTYDSATGVIGYTPGTISAANVVDSLGYTPLNKAGDSVNGDLTITGNLIVNGTTTSVNTTVTTIKDPIIDIGGSNGGAAPTINDNKDRGVKFQYHDGLVAKSGFFGYDSSTGTFTFIPEVTITGEVVSGAAGKLTIADPIDDSHAATKAYVDSKTGVNTASSGVTGAVQLAGDDGKMSNSSKLHLLLEPANTQLEIGDGTTATRIHVDAGANQARLALVGSNALIDTDSDLTLKVQTGMIKFERSAVSLLTLSATDAVFSVPVTLPSNPVLGSQAATKDYVDSKTGSNTAAAGVQTSIQFNNAGVMSGSSDFLWDMPTQTLTMGDATTGASVKSDGTVNVRSTSGSIAFHTNNVQRFALQNNGSLMFGATAGNAGQALVSNGANAAPQWKNVVAGVDKQIQFNDNGTLSGVPGMSWNKANNTLVLGTADATATISGLSGAASGHQLMVSGGANANGHGGYVFIQGGTSSATQAGTGNITLKAGSGGTGTAAYISLMTGFSEVERLRILGNGAWSVGSNGISTGTANQVLTSNGSSAAPTWSTVSTNNVTEGTNLYFTTARARTSITVSGSLAYNATTGVISYTTPSTDGIVEGTTNLYHTVSRVRSSINVSGSLAYNAATGTISYTTPSTDGIAEGLVNKYFTVNRVRAAIGVEGSLSYNEATGVIGYTAPELGAGSGDFKADGTVAMTGQLQAPSVRVKNADVSIQTFPVNVGPTTATTPVVLTSFGVDFVRTAKLIVYVQEGTKFHSVELMVMHDGTNAYMTQYGVLTNNGDLGTFDAAINADYVDVSFTPASENATTVKGEIKLISV